MNLNSNHDNIGSVGLLRLHSHAQGFAGGVIVAFGVFLATNWLVLKGGNNVGAHLQLLGHFFIGYSVTFLGSLIGAFYGFIVGYLMGYSIAHIYNFAANRRDKNVTP